MKESNGEWIMCGLSEEDPNCIRNYKGIVAKVKEYGFLPLFKNKIPGFSVEEMTSSNAWWGDKPEEDPWEWRGVIATEKEVAYGKFFANKAGFISMEWYPHFVNHRRAGYDFDSRYEDGLASHKQKLVMDVMEKEESLQSFRLKALAGFGRGGEKGFDSVVTSLQMLSYLTIIGFEKKRNKKNEEYGWAGAVYATSETYFGYDFVRSAYKDDPKESKEKMISHLIGLLGEENEKEIKKLIK